MIVLRFGKDCVVSYLRDVYLMKFFYFCGGVSV